MSSSSSPVKTEKIGLGGALGIFGTILLIIVTRRLALGFDVALLLMFCGMFTTVVFCFRSRTALAGVI